MDIAVEDLRNMLGNVTQHQSELMLRHETGKEKFMQRQTEVVQCHETKILHAAPRFRATIFYGKLAYGVGLRYR